MANSVHYAGKAFDMRTRIYTKGQVEAIVDELFTLLGEDYDVIDEGDHVHVEPSSRSGAAQTGPVRVRSKQQYDRLPKGAQYVAPDGSLRVKG
jgi:hypothetical protein